MDDSEIAESVRVWIDTFVVDMNLCPFAGRELVKGNVRFVVSDAKTEEQLLVGLRGELDLLDRKSSIETTLLIHPCVLLKFDEYNQFLNLADGLLKHLNLEGVYQIASFHPDYQFADTNPGDAENFTNRSPYPLLHLLREDSLEQAIAHDPNVNEIPIRNIKLMNSLGPDKLRQLMQACIKSKLPES